MKARMEWMKAVPAAYTAMVGLERYLKTCGMDEKLLDLIKLRASQINHCAYCIDMHWKDLRADGETEMRLYGLSAWQESPYYTDRERAALEWTEAVTLLTTNFIPDDLYERVRKHFSEEELVKLTTAIVAINGWNRFCVSFRTEPGHYQAKSKGAAEPK
jgi:AhpD family alkylhydroperoxidase